MLLKLSWRNVWRNKVRTGIIILAITLGLALGLFAAAFVNGMGESRIQNVINNEIGHAQIHHKDFAEEKELTKNIENSTALLKKLNDSPLVKGVSIRSEITGMIASPTSNSGIVIHGVVPEEETKVTKIHELVTTGKYFEGVKRNPILVSEKIAKKLKLKVRSKVVLTFQDVNEDLAGASFRVVGIYKTPNNGYDESNAFIRFSDLQELAGVENPTTIMVRTGNYKQAEQLVEEIQPQISQDLLIEGWYDVDKTIKFFSDQMAVSNYIFLIIILIGLAFGILNTMMMALMERIREIGVLMAVGMEKMKIFNMMMLETILMSSVGGIIGLILGIIINLIFAQIGIDLGSDTGFGEVGISSIVYPFLEWSFYPKVVVLVLITAFLAAIIPARRALKLKPNEAIRAK